MRQNKKRGYIPRLSKFFIPNGEATALVRARTIEDAMMTFDKYHGDASLVDRNTVKRVVVKTEEPIEQGDNLRVLGVRTRRAKPVEDFDLTI